MTNVQNVSLSVLSTQINVGMDEVVSIFVSRFETELYNKKDRLSTEIVQAKQVVTDHTNQVISSIDPSNYVYDLPNLGMSTKVRKVEAVFEDTYSMKVGINVHVDIQRNGKYESLTTVHFPFFNMNEVEIHKQLEQNVKMLSEQLMSVLAEIKTIGRKERQVRGKIAELKLEQSGQSELLNNPELLKLVSSI